MSATEQAQSNEEQRADGIFDRAKEGVNNIYNAAKNKVSEGFEAAKESFEGGHEMSQEEIDAARDRILHGYDHVSHRPVADKTEQGKEMAGHVFEEHNGFE